LAAREFVAASFLRCAENSQRSCSRQVRQARIRHCPQKTFKSC